MMIKKLLLLSFFNLSISSVIYAQITFQETVIDTTNTISISTINQFSTEYSIDATYSADFDGDGDIDLLPKSNPLLWIENTDGQGTLTVHHIIDSELNEIKALRTEDIDGDGDVDIVLAENSFPNDFIAWYENTDGQGTFGAKQIITTQIIAPSTVYVKDIDGDTDLDVVSSSIGDGKIAWYENTDGLGTFGAQQVIATASFSSTTQYIEVVSADFDGDTDNDLLFAANGSPDEAGFWIENTDGQGAFGSPQQLFDVFGGVFYIKVADLDNDGDIDMYGQNNFDGLVVFRNDGQANFGGFGNSFNSNYDGYVGFASAVDVDGDDDLDLLGFVKNEDDTNEGAIIWFENLDGLGTFSDEQIVQTVNFTRNGFRYNIADLDGDGFDDLVCHNLDGYELSWKKNESGLGTFGDSQEIVNDHRGVRDVLSVDLDGDGDKDVVFTSFDNNKIGWYENIDAQGTYGSQQIISANLQGGISITAEDVDNDGDFDLISASKTDDKIAWFENDGSAGFLPQQVISNMSNAVEFVKGVDVDGDNDIDVVAIEEFGDKIAWYENTDGQGSFGTQQVITEAIDDIGPFDIGDLDGDGDLDLLINEPLSWMSNDGQGNFSALQALNSTNDGAVKISDLDGDGDMDVLTSDPCGWLENEDGQGTFGEFQLIDDNTFSTDNLIVLDIDNDGDMDVINTYFASTNSDEIVLYKNYGGFFPGSQTIGFTDERMSAVFADDLNGNGTADILYATNKNTNGSGKIAWYRNLGVLENQISGTVNFDADNNGCDENDIGVPNILVASGNSDAAFSTFTDVNGSFAIDVNQGDFITLITPSLPEYFSISPSIHSTSFGGENEIDNAANFCVTATEAVNDLNVSIYPLSDPRPGFDTSYEIIYNNIGTTTLTGDVEFAFDSSKIQYTTASVGPSSQTADMLSFDFSNLLPFESRSIIVEFNVFAPPVTNIDDILDTTVTVSPVAGDNTESDNTYTLVQTVIGSYDPNDILVLEGEQILFEQTDDYLHYIIRFQNTGTAEAINVRVTNIIDPKLEWFTLQIESLSHNGRIEIIDGIETTFSFDNIFLPSISQNEAESNGYIAYKIKPKQDVSVGDVFYNSASIFFDFNPPIFTNTVATEVVDALSVPDFETQDIELFPNPASDKVNIRSTIPVDRITITDINGREIKTYANVALFLVTNLSNGIYFVKIDSGNKTVIKKLIKN